MSLTKLISTVTSVGCARPKGPSGRLRLMRAREYNWCVRPAESWRNQSTMGLVVLFVGGLVPAFVTLRAAGEREAVRLLGRWSFQESRHSWKLMPLCLGRSSSGPFCVELFPASCDVQMLHARSCDDTVALQECFLSALIVMTPVCVYKGRCVCTWTC